MHKSIACFSMFIFACFILLQMGTGSFVIGYFSVTGHTESLAQAVADGARSVLGSSNQEQLDVIIAPISKLTKEDILNASAIIVGSPVYNGNAAPEVLSFLMDLPFLGNPLQDVVGAAFVTAGGISCGQESVLQSILRSFLVADMIVVGGVDGTDLVNWQPFGAAAIDSESPFGQSESNMDGNIDPQFVEKGNQLGVRVARVALKLHNATKEESVENV
eukprot:TRINITY_DN42682_c0_g2_i1.p2 TRINITY_DN42682_c0_g2~~TRINITY_DN42682_c0_g2_i1.p2  ORF type:complete len:218 (-),score=50.54 TRINITY_DN42682_c0_g2_i1:1146-1799(-)